MPENISEPRINDLFIQLTYYVGEDIIPEQEEIRIIDIEENYRETGGIPLKDLIWLKRLLIDLKA